jgi:uncharacterized membrane protein YeaQ/YmgE (transglycosylase-associated protein family)
MSFLWFILIGLVAGFLAGKVMRGGGFGWLINILVGIGGAILGGWLIVYQLGLSIGISPLVDALIIAFVGACLLLWIISLFKRK